MRILPFYKKKKNAKNVMLFVKKNFERYVETDASVKQNVFLTILMNL